MMAVAQTQSRPVIQLHTIEQWLATDPAIRAVILQNIKLKDRLQRHILAKRDRQLKPLESAFWAKCLECDGSGHVLVEPRYPGIHPSQLSSPCLLKVYKEMEGQESRERFEARQLLVFEIGKFIHKMFQHFGKEGAWGPHYWPEAKVNGDLQQVAELLMLEGSADADNILVLDDIPDCPYIYEVGLIHEYKSAKKEVFERLTRPKPEHKTQAMLYSAARNRPIVVYLYLNKNDQNLIDFPVPFEPELWANVENKARTLVRAYDTHTPPEANTGFHCQDCAYAFQCEAYRNQVQRRRA